MCSIRVTRINVEREENQLNKDETLLRPGSVGVNVRLGMFVPEKGG